MTRKISLPAIKGWIIATFAFSAGIAMASTLPASALPLHTSGHSIMDAQDHPIRLISVNWYGFDEKEYVAGGLDHAPLQQIVQKIYRMGFNSVRLPWSNEMLEHNPVVPAYAIAANPHSAYVSARTIAAHLAIGSHGLSAISRRTTLAGATGR